MASIHQVSKLLEHLFAKPFQVALRKTPRPQISWYVRISLHHLRSLLLHIILGVGRLFCHCSSGGSHGDVAVFVSIAGEVAEVGIDSYLIRRLTLEAAEDVREIGGGVVLVDTVGVDTAVTFIKIVGVEGLAVLVDRTVDGETVEGDTDQLGGVVEETTGGHLVVVVLATPVWMTIAKIKDLEV